MFSAVQARRMLASAMLATPASGRCVLGMTTARRSRARVAKRSWSYMSRWYFSASPPGLPAAQWSVKARAALRAACGEESHSAGSCASSQARYQST